VKVFIFLTFSANDTNGESFFLGHFWPRLPKVKVSYFEHFWPKIPMVIVLFFLCHFWPSMQTVKVFVFLSHFRPKIPMVKDNFGQGYFYWPLWL